MRTITTTGEHLGPSLDSLREIHLLAAKIIRRWSQLYPGNYIPALKFALEKLQYSEVKDIGFNR